MAGVQVMPAVAAVEARAEGRVAVSSGRTSLFAGDWRRRPRRPACSVRALSRQGKSGRSRGGLRIVCNLGGQYEDSFEDVQLVSRSLLVPMSHFLMLLVPLHAAIDELLHLQSCETVLNQLYELNPPSYRWFYNFVAVNKPTDGKLFLRALGKERQELAERVMVTRLHLYGKWIKKCDHAKMYEKISDENLTLMRERLMETVVWPTDDADTEKIG
ncbi:hypothetical protein PR202_gb10543 [Eleusine coracana subsp. coracana]|uniref:Chaperonin-like RbcX protein n=1 Tax=Eleusine coracana subsp. coracana TaxID=191504 RepID=A0AAV5EHW6_ELECO|nr:hypothetical protein PR202_gb10543 [Eleusine coracana subsp. coracana]